MDTAGRVGRIVAFLPTVLLAGLSISCLPAGFTRQFEYEQELYLRTDGSATVVVNSSIPALVVMNGVPVDSRPDAQVDRAAIRGYFESAGLQVTRVSRPWRRRGRRFVQVRLDVPDISRLSSASPFAWASFEYQRKNGVATYRETIGRPPGKPPENVSWDGSELVGFRMHVPSRILFHNAPSKRVERGNILTWQQTLRDRLAGLPIEIVVRMEPQSILYRTLLIFVGAAAAALLLLAAAIWWVVRRGRAQALTAGEPRAGS